MLSKNLPSMLLSELHGSFRFSVHPHVAHLVSVLKHQKSFESVPCNNIALNNISIKAYTESVP